MSTCVEFKLAYVGIRPVLLVGIDNALMLASQPSTVKKCQYNKIHTRQTQSMRIANNKPNAVLFLSYLMLLKKTRRRIAVPFITTLTALANLCNSSWAINWSTIID